MLEALGHYRILDRIGSGGLGDVYRARDTRLGRTVAIKVPALDTVHDSDRRRRLVEDARAAAALSHPSIAALYEAGEDHGRLFLVFEFVPGETLKRVIGGRPLNPRRAADFAAQIADGLAEAHAHGIVHCDIASGNIIITPKEKAKILDFGLARWTGGGTARERAGVGGAVPPATAAYLSPEQARGRPIDHRTDIFSLGIVLFEMVTGQLPFTAATAAALAGQIAESTAAVPSAINRTAPVELEAVIQKALARDPDARYASAAVMAAELRSLSEMLDARARQIESTGRARVAVAAPARSRPHWIVLAILAAALAAAVWYAWNAFHM
jgi:serine/threonine protein kinase